MNLETIVAIANIMASLAVILTLVFIGLQLRQNMHLTRMSTAQTSAQMLSQNFGRVIESADLAEILTRSDRAADLEGADLLRVTNFVAVTFRYFEILHTHRRYNIFEPELWTATEARLCENLKNTEVLIWWEDNQRFYARSFADYVNGLIAKKESVQA